MENGPKNGKMENGKMENGTKNGEMENGKMEMERRMEKWKMEKWKWKNGQMGEVETYGVQQSGNLLQCFHHLYLCHCQQS